MLLSLELNLHWLYISQKSVEILQNIIYPRKIWLICYVVVLDVCSYWAHIKWNITAWLLEVRVFHNIVGVCDIWSTQINSSMLYFCHRWKISSVLYSWRAISIVEMPRGLTFGWQSPIIHRGEVWYVTNLRKMQALNICNEYISTYRLFKYSIIYIYIWNTGERMRYMHLL